jgi:chorismate synthase
VLADAVVEKFGGDSIGETRRNARAYYDRLAERGMSSGEQAGQPAPVPEPGS